MGNQTNVNNIIGPHSEWEPSTKTINVRATTWKRLQKHHTHHGQTFDSIITDLLNEKEKIIDSDMPGEQKNSKIGEFKI